MLRRLIDDSAKALSHEIKTQLVPIVAKRVYQEAAMPAVPVEPYPEPPMPVPPQPDIPPVEEPEPDRLPDEVPVPNPDENDGPPKVLSCFTPLRSRISC